MINRGGGGGGGRLPGPAALMSLPSFGGCPERERKGKVGQLLFFPRR